MSNVLKPRGRPFQPGNPGRPPGSKNKITKVLDQLAEGEAEELYHIVSKQARAGSGFQQKMILDRIWPARRGEPVNICMPPIETPQDVFAAIAAVWTALREGRITPEQAAALSIVIERSSRTMEIYNIEKRLMALEQAQDKRNEKDDSTSA